MLGVQWLQTLGPIVWDFRALSMRFKWNQQQFKLEGIQGGAIHFAFKKQLAKLPCNKGTNTLLLSEDSFLHLMSVTTTGKTYEISNIQLQELLSEYAQLFEPPTGLLPKKSHDHRIRFKDDKVVVKMNY